MILKTKPDKTSPKKLFQGKIPNRERSKITENVSRNCEAKVEKLFLNQSIFPLLSFFQK
jgi:hypothetical protein